MNRDAGSSIYILIFIFLIGIIFLTIPSIIYYLKNKNFKPIKKLVIPIGGLIFGLLIGPYISINLMSYTDVMSHLESHAKRGHWSVVTQTYKALYLRHTKLGMPYVRQCQTKLKMAAYYNGEIDGIPNSALTIALLNFQKNMGLPLNQKIDDNTNTLLVAYIYPTTFNITKGEVHFNNILKIRANVVLFQKANNLTPDGGIGEMTERKIFQQKSLSINNN